MKLVHRVTSNHGLRSQTTWKLLAAKNAPAIIGILHTHLFGDVRRLSSSILHERIAQDLRVLKEAGFEDLENKLEAKAYLQQWLSDGYLERSYDAKVGEEVYELSAGAIQAIRFIETLSQQRSVATESRLSMVIQQLTQLTTETDPDPESRVKSLIEEQTRIQVKIDAIRSGDQKPLAEDRALERLREIILLVYELANDFRQVRDKFNQLNLQLREKIIESEESRGGVLEELFAGVDVIAESDAGKTFRAFWSLLTDPQQSMELEVSLDQLTEREFSKSLSREERKFLLGMTRLLLVRGSDVHETLQFFARSLKQYVTSREYLEHRRFSQKIKEAQRLALEIKNTVNPTDQIGYNLRLTSIKLSSVSQLKLNDPSLHYSKTGIDLAGPPRISLESVSEMVANSEINFRQLKKNIQAIIINGNQVTIKDILDKYPAEQGLGSVIGYLSIGTRHGVLSRDKEETVQWKGMDGQYRIARIPCMYFQKGCFDGRQKAR